MFIKGKPIKMFISIFNENSLQTNYELYLYSLHYSKEK